MFKDFEDLMRTHEPSDVEEVLAPLNHLNTSDPLHAMLSFCQLNQDSIKDEIRLLRDLDGGTRWDLELSQTMAHWLLAHWGEEFESLDAYCDESKPIESNMDMFNQFIGRTDKAYIRLGGEPKPSMVYNLSGPMKLVDSLKYAGIQIADVLASSIAYSLKNNQEEFSHQCLELAENSLTLGIIADPEEFQPDRGQGFSEHVGSAGTAGRGAWKGEDLFYGMEDYILYCQNMLPSFREYQKSQA